MYKNLLLYILFSFLIVFQSLSPSIIESNKFFIQALIIAVLSSSSLFFLIFAIFSAFFPLFQSHRKKRRRWTLYYLPVSCFAASIPLFMMGGIPRPTIGILVAGFGAYHLYKRYQNGWKF